MWDNVKVEPDTEKDVDTCCVIDLDTDVDGRRVGEMESLNSVALVDRDLEDIEILVETVSEALNTKVNVAPDRSGDTDGEPVFADTECERVTACEDDELADDVDVRVVVAVA